MQGETEFAELMVGDLQAVCNPMPLSDYDCSPTPCGGPLGPLHAANGSLRVRAHGLRK